MPSDQEGRPFSGEATARPAVVAMRRRYLSLGTGELAAATIFAVVGWGVLRPALPDGAQVALAWAVIPLLLVLVQGGAYWLLARSWIGRGRMPRRLAAMFLAFGVTDVFLLVSALVGIVIAWSGPVAGGVVTAVWAFGVAEFVNYFVVRLSYPARTWARQVTRWRVPVLARDVRRSLTTER